MIQNNQLDLHPETERRKQDLDLLKAEYTNQWNNRQVLLEWGKPQLCALYTLRIGRLQIDLLEQRAALFSVKYTFEMMQAAINRNEEINRPYIDLMVEIEMRSQVDKIQEEIEKLNHSKKLFANLVTPECSIELRKVFREMAKELHPDINQDLSERAKNLWNAVMVAYTEGDLESLRALRLMVSDVKNKKEDFVDENLLLTQINFLKDGISRILIEIENIKKEFPFDCEQQIYDDAWIAEQQADLKEVIEAFIEQKNGYLKSISLINQTFDL